MAARRRRRVWHVDLQRPIHRLMTDSKAEDEAALDGVGD
jgi:hypothetical protein